MSSGGAQRVSWLNAGGVAFLAFVLGFLVVGGATVASTIRSREIATMDAIPPTFPVVVVTRQESEPRTNCRVMFYRDLASASREAALSYVVGDSEVPSCKEQIAAQREIVSSGPAGTLPLWFAFAAFSPVSPDGTQEIDLSATWDDDWVNRGWYLARAEGVQPLRYQGFGAGLVFVAFPLGFAAGVVSSLIATTVFVRHKARRPGARPSDARR